MKIEAEAHRLYLEAVEFATGEDGNIDQQKAVSLYAKASRLGHADAAYELAWATLRGEGDLQSDSKRALRLFRKAALLGSGDSNVVLGEAYLCGFFGTKRNKLLAARFLCAGVMLGSARAAKSVAKFLDHELPVKLFRDELARVGGGTEP